MIRASFTCAWCGQRFAATRDTVRLIGTEQQPKYCGQRCRKAVNRTKPLATPCPACGQPRYRGDQHGMCTSCNSVAYLACWSKKVAAPEQLESVRHEDGKMLYPYRCEVCGQWHLTSRAGGVHESWSASAKRVGAHLAAVNWDFSNAAWRKAEIRRAEL